MARSVRPRPSYVIAGVYLVVGALWILLSDRLADALFAGSTYLGIVQTSKGWFYVAVTAVLLFVFIHRELLRRDRLVRLAEQAAEDRAEIMRELHHRVRNNLQLIHGLIQLEQDEQGESAQTVQALQNVYNRFSAVNVLHELMYASGEFCELDCHGYVSTLVERFKTENPADADWELRVESRRLAVDQLIPLGLIVGEFLTAVVEMVDARERPSVEVSLSADGGMVRLELAYRGEGGPVFGTGDGLSLHGTLIRVLADQLGGEVQFQEQGLRGKAIVNFREEALPVIRPRPLRPRDAAS